MRTATGIAPPGFDEGPPASDLAGAIESPFDMPGYKAEKERPRKPEKGEKLYEWVLGKVGAGESELLNQEGAANAKDREERARKV